MLHFCTPPSHVPFLPPGVVERTREGPLVSRSWQTQRLKAPRRSTLLGAVDKSLVAQIADPDLAGASGAVEQSIDLLNYRGGIRSLSRPIDGDLRVSPQKDDGVSRDPATKRAFGPSLTGGSSPSARAKQGSGFGGEDESNRIACRHQPTFLALPAPWLSLGPFSGISRSTPPCARFRAQMPRKHGLAVSRLPALPQKTYGLLC